MNTKSFLTYVSCAIASFALATAGIAQASTLYERYSSFGCLPDAGGDAKCQWVTNDLFGASDLSSTAGAVVVTFHNNSGSSLTPTVALCAQSGATHLSAGCGGTTNCTVAASSGLDCSISGTTLSTWYNNSADYLYLDVTTDSAAFLGYKISN